MESVIKSYLIRNRISLLVLAVVLLISLLPLSSGFLGTYKVGDCVQIKTILNSSWVNISTISVPPNSTIVLTQISMTKSGQTFYYTFCNTTNPGTYVYDYYDNGGNTYVNDFEVTYTGSNLPTAKSVAYVLIFIFSLLVFVFLLAGALSIDGKNTRDEMTGYILAVSNMKYVKVFLFAVCYLIALFISYFSWMITYAYLDMNFLSSLFRLMFYILLASLLPLFIIGSYVTIANWIRDNKIAEFLSRGLRVK